MNLAFVKLVEAMREAQVAADTMGIDSMREKMEEINLAKSLEHIVDLEILKYVGSSRIGYTLTLTDSGKSVIDALKNNENKTEL